MLCAVDIVDIKPVNMEELTEVITATEFHPTHCNQFMYSSSKSNIKLADMRDSALCDKHAKCELLLLPLSFHVSRAIHVGFEEEEDPTTRSFFSEIISSISDVKFSHDGRYILSRDYLSLKIWDVNMETRPVKTIPIHDHLRGKLCDLYENDCIFDKFECVWGGDDKCETSLLVLFHVLIQVWQARVDRIIPQLLPYIRLGHAE
jgi:serine/threonine-protein phosphatase 2A regulatory subunit B